MRNRNWHAQYLRRKANGYFVKYYYRNRERLLKYHSEYWKTTTQERKTIRKAKTREADRRRRVAHPEAPMIYYRRTREKWSGGVNCLDEKVWRHAEHLAEGIVEKMGYTNQFQPQFRFFYFDILAKRDGKIAAFQVTTLRVRQIKRKHIELASYLGLEFFIIHVKPTMDVAYVSRIETNPVPSSKVVNYYFRRGQEFHLR